MLYGHGKERSACPGYSGSTRTGCQLHTQCGSAEELLSFAQGLNWDPNISNGQLHHLRISLIAWLWITFFKWFF